MSNKKTLQTLRTYRKKSGRTAKQNYLGAFTSKMIYRTTKTENPTTSRQLVKKVLAGRS